MKTQTIVASLVIAALAAGLFTMRDRLGTSPAQASGMTARASSGLEPAVVPQAGAVTFEDYQAGFQAMAACLAKIGWVPERPPRLTSRQVYEYQFTIPNADTHASAAQRRAWENGFQECQTRYFDQVQRVWETRMAMSPGERQVARDFLSACMRGEGVQIAEHPAEADLVPFIRITPDTDLAAHRVLQRCQAETERQFDLRNGELP